MTYLTTLDKLYPAQDIWCEGCVNWHPATQWDEVEPRIYQCPDCLDDLDLNANPTVQRRPTESDS